MKTIKQTKGCPALKNSIIKPPHGSNEPVPMIRWKNITTKLHGIGFEIVQLLKEIVADYLTSSRIALCILDEILLRVHLIDAVKSKSG